MKRFIICFFLSGISFSSFSISRTWIGLSGGVWSAGTNWSPNGLPAAGDDIIINTFAGAILIDVPGPIALNSISIQNNSMVVFDCPGTRNFLLSGINPAIPGLLIQSGSALTLDGSNIAGVNNSSFDLTYGSGVIGNIYGTLIMSRSMGTASVPGVQLVTDRNATNYSVVTVHSGGIIKINIGGGNTSSSMIPVPTLVMKNGSLYENLKNGGSFPAGNWEPNSLARASTLGSNGPLFNGSVYGDLEWNCPNQSAITFLSSDLTFNNVNFISTNNMDFRIKTGASPTSYTMTVNGNMSLGSNSVVNITGNTAAPPYGGKLHLKGNLNNSGTIKSEGIGGTINDLELNGSLNQNINTVNLPVSPLVFIINNPSGATLLSNLMLPGNLSLTNGIISTTSSAMLILRPGSFYTGGSINSFINGPMKKIGNTGFLFPVGTALGGAIYAPVGILNISNESVNDEFISEYKRINPQGVRGPNVQAGQDHVSYVEYWSINQTGAAVKKVSLKVNATSFCKDVDNTFVGRWDGPLNYWVSEGSVVTGAGSAPPYQTGTITSANTISTFGDFTLITDLDELFNPLPIDLVSFDVTKLTTARSSVSWELAACCSPTAKFEVERAGGNRNFVRIYSFAGSATNRLYSCTDNDMQAGINYYRLKMIDADGTITYSRVVAIMNGAAGLLFTSLIPTVINNIATLFIASTGSLKMELLIIDMQGRVMLKQKHAVAEGNTTIQLSVAGLAAGVYQLVGVSPQGNTNAISFVKQ